MREVRSVAVLVTREINRALREGARNGGVVRLEGLDGQDSVAVGLDAVARVELEGRVGDYFAALNKSASITLKGDAGRFAADTMTGGEVVIQGDAGHGLGFSLCGGTVVVKGNAGGRLGQMNKNGTIIVDGDVGDVVGLYALGGDIVITGDSGEKTGEWLVGGRIFVGGEVRGLGRNAKEEPLSAEDADKLRELFARYDIKRSPDGFRKIVPEKLRPFYKGKGEGK